MELNTAVDTVKIAAQVVTADTQDAKDTLTMVTGAVVRVKPMKDRLAFKLYQMYPEPKPPINHITVEGKEWNEENPNDPEYIAALAAYRTSTYEAYTKILLMTCVEVVSLPDGVLPFDQDTEWIDEMKMLGFECNYANRLERWLDWLTYRIVVSSADQTRIQELASKLAGVTEEQIKAAEDSFHN
jgi:hypothetical protein